MKIAPLLRELGARPGFESFLVHTGQHYDAAMSEGFFRDLGIPEPDVNLGVGSGSHGAQTGQILIEIEQLLMREEPDVVLVVGDVNSTLAATLAAVKLHIPTDSVSNWLFTTEEAGDRNLAAEGVEAARVHMVGNVMIDTLLGNLEKARDLDTLERLGLEAGGYALLTLHRPSNVDDPEKLEALFSALEEIHRELPILFPVHPRTMAAIERLRGGKRPALQLTEPLGYLDFLRLMADARLVLTDSGGIQEETTALGVSCLTLRENTERPVTVTEGTNTIVGSDPETILAEARKILDGGGKSGRRPKYWDGGAAGRIVDVLERDLGGKA
jgi:UDP-N-acetylglucosamine 2-epimerase (non-hydrolysing)